MKDSVPRLLDRCPYLRQMLDTQTARTLAGEMIPLHSNIPIAYAQALYELVLREQPSLVVEIGMAFGTSSLAILSALRDSGGTGRLISIDPDQTRHWQGVGLTGVSSAGLSDGHEVIEDYDYNVLPRLLAAGTEIDLAYIDGWHTFDYALLDWWYIHKMLRVGGVVGFNDCGWPAVDKVIHFVMSHRNYVELEAGLPVTFAVSRKRELFRRLAFGPKNEWYAMTQDRYFRKADAEEPRWDFFAPF